MKIRVWYPRGDSECRHVMYDSSVNVGRMEVKNILLDKLISSVKEVENIVCTVANKEKCSSELAGVRTYYAMK